MLLCSKTMSRDINPFGLRMPPELRQRLEQAIQESGRSMNAEIVHRLEESLNVKKFDAMATGAKIDVIHKLVESLVYSPSSATQKKLAPGKKKR